MKRATAQNVAIEAGVSKWTVIRAFTPGASITEASKAKVLEAAERLNYRPNLLARSLATNSTHQVAVLVDDFANPHKLPFLEKLTASLQAEGLVTMLININEHYSHVHAILNADQRQVDAIVLFGTAFHDEMLTDHKLGRGGPPMFVLARDSQIEGVPAISCDAVVAIAEIGKYLLEKGYRRPGFMAGAVHCLRRLAGGGTLRSFGEPLSGSNSSRCLPSAIAQESGAQAARDYLSKIAPEDRIDVLMCENDALAFGAMDVARSEFGLRVPNDLAIVGFDNAAPAASPAYGLTTYEQPTDQMVKATIDMILERAPRETVNFQGKLVVRGSA
ncbi:LacI family DNA-binding transcriptional regulator (plasmid) [Rhizobium sp. RCAM05350]|nr:LacI family DNA-binding transcriptional regulator [Rhizobium sp. RCAM05350]